MKTWLLSWFRRPPARQRTIYLEVSGCRRDAIGVVYVRKTR